MLYSGRKQQQDLAEREAAGESFWTTEFTAEVRVKLRHVVRDAVGSSEGILRHAHGLVCRQRGLEVLHGVQSRVANDLLTAMAYGPNDMVADIIEAVEDSLRYAIGFPLQLAAPARGTAFFEDEVNRIFREDRVAFEIVEGQMVALGSEELHSEIVGPTLRLLSGRSGWEGIEETYQKALAEISDGHPDDAITDAGTALQEALTVLGCHGNSLGPLIKDARRTGLLAPHDARLDAAIENIMEWVSADRSQSGEAHHVSTATTDDAWLIVHVVGALILRLSGPPRASGTT